MGFVEEMAVLEELGYALFPGPFFSTVALALPALRPAEDLVVAVGGGEATATLAWPEAEDASGAGVAAEPDGDGWRLSGTTLFVPDLHMADLVVVAARCREGTALAVVERDAEGVRIEGLPTVDTTRPLGSLRLSGAAGRALARGDQADMILAGVRDQALSGLAAEAVGVAQRALDLAVEHARTREQFGRPIGVYQGVSHALADAFVEIESARSLAHWAGWAVASQAAEAPEAAAAAKAFAAEAAVDACERAIQVLGGIGFTWEHILHRFYKRTLWIAAYLGWPAELRARVASALLD
jgi:alkylation response protein AidB-like acyl-CoA dehydrogenase